MGKVISIGRSNKNDIVLGYPQISRHHAEIELVDQEKLLFRLRDLETLNGTFKNGEKIQDVVFNSQKDKIMVGHINIRPSLYLPYFFDGSPQIQGESEKTAVRPESAGKTRLADDSQPAPGVSDGGRQSAHVGPKQVLSDRNLASPRRKRWLDKITRASLPLYLGVFLLGVGTATAFAENVSTDVVYSLIGYCVLVAFLASIANASIESMGRFAYQKTQQAISLELLEEKVNAVRIQRVENERAQYAWNGYRKFVVTRKVKECESVYSVYLAPHDKKLLPAFKPGQYLTIGLKIDDREKPVVRCYSLSCSAVETDEFRISVKKLPHGACSSYLHEKLQEGDILDVRAPSGHFFLDVTAGKPIVLIAGGIGITPILSMLNTLADIGSHRDVWIFYGTTNGEFVVQQEHLIDLVSNHPNFHLHFCFSRPRHIDPIDDLHFNSRVTVDFLKEILNSNNYEFYICGPGEMMQNITAGLEAWGVPKAHIHFEGFGPATVKRISAPHSQTDEAGTQHDVQFSRSNKSCVWSPDSGSILNLARANDVNIDSGCEAGNCGSCIVAIREGDVDYLSEPGAMPEKGSCLACIAIPKGKLVIEA